MAGVIDMGGYNIGNVGTVNGQALSGNVTLVTTDVGEGTNLNQTIFK